MTDPGVIAVVLVGLLISLILVARWAAVAATTPAAVTAVPAATALATPSPSWRPRLSSRPRLSWLLAEWALELPPELRTAFDRAQEQGRTAVAAAWDGKARAIFVVADTIGHRGIDQCRRCRPWCLSCRSGSVNGLTSMVPPMPTAGRPPARSRTASGSSLSSR